MRLGFFLFFAVCCMAVPLGASCVNTRILASLSEQIGEVASMAAIEGMVPGAEQLPSAFPGDGKQGQFDLVYRGPDGTIYIVESKGGSAELGTKKGKNAQGNEVDLQQGTPEYLEAILTNMERVAADTGDRKLRDTAREIRNAMASTPPKIQYLHASQKIDADGSNPPDLNISKFDIQP
jgi:hypothetical protein